MFHYAPNQLISQVVIFGVGGTGGRLVPLVTQLLATQHFTKRAKVILMDGDIVEEKNCKRQLFIPSEVGKNKANVMAARYKRAFGSNTVAVPHFFPLTAAMPSQSRFRDWIDFLGQDSNTGLRELLFALASADDASREVTSDRWSSEVRNNSVTSTMGSELLIESRKYLSKGLTVFILAVDSVEARKAIINFIQQLASGEGVGYDGYDYSLPNFASNIVVIDGGNEDVFGQVNYFSPVTYDLCAFSDIKSLPDRTFFQMPLAAVPFPVGRYENMQEGASERRCGDVDQTLSVNNMVATMMHLIFHNLYYNIPMNFHKINFNLNGALTTEYMTGQWMKGVLTDNPAYNMGVVTKPIPLTEHAFILEDDVGEGARTDTDLNLYGCSRLKHSPLNNDPCSSKISRWHFHMSGSNDSRDIKLREVVAKPEEKEYFYLTKRTNYLSSSWTSVVMPWMFEMIKRGQYELTDYLKFAAKVLAADTSVLLYPLIRQGNEEHTGDIRRVMDNVRHFVNDRSWVSGSAGQPWNRNSNCILFQAGYTCVVRNKYPRASYDRSNSDTWAFQPQGLLVSNISGKDETLAVAEDGNIPVIGANCAVSYSASIRDQVMFSSTYVTMQEVLAHVGHIEASRPVIEKPMSSVFIDKLEETLLLFKGSNLIHRPPKVILPFLAGCSFFGVHIENIDTHHRNIAARAVRNMESFDEPNHTTFASRNVPYGQRSNEVKAFIDYNGRINSDTPPLKNRMGIAAKFLDKFGYLKL